MSTVTPHNPQPGYQKRWLKQAFALMTRSPAALILTIIGSSLVSLLAAMIAIPVMMATGLSTAWTLSLFTVMGAVGVAFVSLGTTALFFRADDKPGVGLAAVVAAWKHCAWPIAKTLIVIELIFLAILSRPTLDTAVGEVSSSGGLAELVLVSLMATVPTTSATIVALVWISPLLFPFLLGMGGGIPEAKAFYSLIQRKHHGVYFHIFLVTMPIIITITVVPLVGILLFHYYLAWLYVATRELAGGISENSKETVKAPAAAVPTTS